MKTNLIIAIISLVTLLIGCASQHKGPAYGYESLFRQQIAESVPVKDWGYRMQDFRFSDDYQKALVTLIPPGNTNAIQELVLENDGFRRYRGKVTALERTRNPESWVAWVTVTLPDR